MPETRHQLREERRKAEDRMATEYGWPAPRRPSRWRARLRIVAIMEVFFAVVLAGVYGPALVDPLVAIALVVSAALLLIATEIRS